MKFETHAPNTVAEYRQHLEVLSGLGLSWAVIFQLLMLVITNGPKVIQIVSTIVAAIKAGGLTPEVIAQILAQWPGVQALIDQILAILGVAKP